MARHAVPFDDRLAMPSWSRQAYTAWSGECAPGGHGECDGGDGCECPCHRTDDPAIVYGTMATVEKWHAGLHRKNPLNPNRPTHKKEK